MGAQVATDFDETLALYSDLTGYLADLGTRAPGTQVRVFSDTILVVGSQLFPVLSVANTVSFVALTKDCLVRGGVAFGPHAELEGPGSLFVLSQPLVWAAELEKTVRSPCIAIHSSALPVLETDELLRLPIHRRPLLYYDRKWIVNPFNIFWGTSAGTRVSQLRALHPEHREKYDWFLGLYNAVAAGDTLIPP